MDIGNSKNYLGIQICATNWGGKTGTYIGEYQIRKRKAQLTSSKHGEYISQTWA